MDFQDLLSQFLQKALLDSLYAISSTMSTDAKALGGSIRQGHHNAQQGN
jgi:hypothetical protein